MDGNLTTKSLWLFQPCENCGGEGGFADEGLRGYWDVCPSCDGTGELPSIERDLISLDDLDAINRDKPIPESEPC